MDDETALDPNYWGQRQPRRVDDEIAALAERQHGLVTREQLLALGLRRKAIDYRVSCGRLHVVQRGVYAVGHRLLSREGRWMAAVLAAGPGAVLSHTSAAALWRIRSSSGRRVDVTVPRVLRSRSAVRFHHASLPDDEVSRVRGMAVTTPPRTLLDLAGVVSRHELERAFREAAYLRLTDPRSVADLVARRPDGRGRAATRAILADRRIGATVTRSELEERFLSLVDTFDLPRPHVNALLDLPGAQRIEVDCLWRHQSLVVELDGHASHATSRGFERDRARDRALQAIGWRVIRITWRQLHEDSGAVVRDLRALLSTTAGGKPAERQNPLRSGSLRYDRGALERATDLLERDDSAQHAVAVDGEQGAEVA